jgi:hypothetical protein
MRVPLELKLRWWRMTRRWLDCRQNGEEGRKQSKQNAKSRRGTQGLTNSHRKKGKSKGKKVRESNNEPPWPKQEKAEAGRRRK